MPGTGRGVGASIYTYVRITVTCQWQSGDGAYKGPGPDGCQPELEVTITAPSRLTPLKSFSNRGFMLSGIGKAVCDQGCHSHARQFAWLFGLWHRACKSIAVTESTAFIASALKAPHMIALTYILTALESRNVERGSGFSAQIIPVPGFVQPS